MYDLEYMYFKRKLLFLQKLYEDNFLSRLLKKNLGVHVLLLCFICCIKLTFNMHFDVALNLNEK